MNAKALLRLGIISVFSLATAFVTAKADEHTLQRIEMDAYALGAGDVISVVVWKNSDLSMRVPVSPDGKISFPLIGEVQAAGRTVYDLSKIITRELGRHIRNPQVSVIIEDVRSFRIYVVGEVLRPGVFELKGPVTMIQAIAMAGGFTPFASRQRIFIEPQAKTESSRVLFNYKTFVNGDNKDQNVVLNPGDTVVVP